MRDFVLIGAILAAMAAIQFAAARGDAQTYDEAGHLVAGYTYLRTGSYHVNPEHPPLGRILSALPLLPLRPVLGPEDPEWGGDARLIGAVFLFRNRVDPDTMLMAARSATIASALALGLLLALWSRARFGTAAALLALLLFALDPNVLAHGRYVTTDLYSALFSFAACAAWGEYLERRGRLRLALAGTALGLALATKFSLVFLAPVFVVLWAIRRWQGGAVRAGALPAVFTLAILTVALVYAPDTARAIAHPTAGPRLADKIEHQTLFGRMLWSTGKALNLPAHPYLVGFESVARHDRIGHPSYLLGQISQRGGHWYYFPVAFGVKAPLALLAAILLALLLGLRGVRLRKLPFHYYVLAVPLILYLGLAINSKLNIGVRHLLPAWPFFLPLVAAPLARRRSLAVAVAALSIAEAAWIHPHHLAHFNLIAGGPSRGDRWLLDSNLDWAQDVKRLRRWLDEHGNPPVCFAYFGTADTAYYGVPHNGLTPASRGCVGAVSANLLHDLYLEPGTYAWLRARQPLGKAGYSIVLYDLRR